MLELAVRVPDHGKLVPWRMLTLEGAAKHEFGERLARLALHKDPDLPQATQEKNRLRYTYAPLVIVVIARIDDAHRIPAQEQLLSAGCVAYNLLLAAQAFGFGAQWLTGWAAYDRDAANIMGLSENEKVVGFIHIGTATRDARERHRPDPDAVVSAWKLP